MKPVYLLVALASLSVALSAGIVWTSRTPRLAAVSVQPAANFTERSTESATPQKAKSDRVTPAPARPEFTWRQVESEDYHRYIANLRTIGCPEQTIRDIIIADVNKLFAARENPLKMAPQSTRTDGVPNETVEQRLARLQQLRSVQQEKRWVIKELLDVDLPLDLLPSSGSRDYHAFEVALGQLPEEKRDAVQALQENYWQQSDALKATNGKKKSPDTTAQAKQLADSLHQELANFLTPQELEDYELRTSSPAKSLSDKLASYFRPTEDEFRQIYRAQRDYDATLAQLTAKPAVNPVVTADGQALPQAPGASKQDLNQARTAALDQFNNQLRSALGDDRYNDYQRSQDKTYDLLARLGTRYSLPQDTVVQAYDLQKSFNASAQVPNGGAQPDRAALQQQFEQQMTALLGDQAARGYRRVNGGSMPIK